VLGEYPSAAAEQLLKVILSPTHTELSRTAAPNEPASIPFHIALQTSPS